MSFLSLQGDEGIKLLAWDALFAVQKIDPIGHLRQLLTSDSIDNNDDDQDDDKKQAAGVVHRRVLVKAEQSMFPHHQPTLERCSPPSRPKASQIFL